MEVEVEVEMEMGGERPERGGGCLSHAQPLISTRDGHERCTVKIHNVPAIPNKCVMIKYSPARQFRKPMACLKEDLYYIKLFFKSI
jgi:hypothetical protein